MQAAAKLRAVARNFEIPTPPANDIMDNDERGRALRARPKTLLSSSMAEHPAVNRRVVGSSPT